jgi:hypothetical protein
MSISLSGSLLLTGSIVASGNLTTTGTITAQTLVVQTITSSIVNITGSNIFGSQLSDRQTFTGSVVITGSLTVNTTGPEFQVNNNGVVLGNLLTDNHSITGSLRITGSNVIIAGAATFASSVTTNGILTVNEDGASTKVITVRSNFAGVDPAINVTTNNSLLLMTNNTERMRISSAGTASFTANTLSNAADAATINLKQNSTTANTGIYLERSGERRGYYIYVGGSVDSLNFRRNDVGTQSDVMSLTRDGNVGIGTCSPSQRLEVVGGEIKAGRVDSTNEGGQLSFGRALDNNTAWYIDAYGNAASPQLRFVNVDNAVVAMTITGSNVGMNTLSITTTPLHGIKTFEAGPTSAYNINLPAEFPNMLLTAGNVWGIRGKGTFFNGGAAEVRDFLISRNSGGSWSSANYGPSSCTSGGILQSVAGTGTCITINMNSNSYVTVEVTAMVR